MEAVNQSREAISGCRSCKDQGLGFRVQGLGFRVHHIRFFVDCFLKFCFLCCCSIIVFLFLFLWTGWSVQWTSAECNDLWLVMGLTNLVLKHFLKAWFYLQAENLSYVVASSTGSADLRVGKWNSIGNLWGWWWPGRSTVQLQRWRSTSHGSKCSISIQAWASSCFRVFVCSSQRLQHGEQRSYWLQIFIYQSSCRLASQ